MEEEITVRLRSGITFGLQSEKAAVPIDMVSTL
jgi:hypothetical protein